MKFTVVITGSPTNSQACHSALQFCLSAISLGHSIYRVFILDHAAGLAHKHTRETQLQNDWQQIQQKHNLDIVVCVNSARGQYIHDDNLLATGFVISGMGQLIDATANSDRLITFGY